MYDIFIYINFFFFIKFFFFLKKKKKDLNFYVKKHGQIGEENQKKG